MNQSINAQLVGPVPCSDSATEDSVLSTRRRKEDGRRTCHTRVYCVDQHVHELIWHWMNSNTFQEHYIDHVFCFLQRVLITSLAFTTVRRYYSPINKSKTGTFHCCPSREVWVLLGCVRTRQDWLSGFDSSGYCGQETTGHFRAAHFYAGPGGGTAHSEAPPLFG